MTAQSPNAGLVERVARALYAVAQDEARKIAPSQPLPSYEDDDEDSRAMCRRMAEAAIAALAPPQADHALVERLRTIAEEIQERSSDPYDQRARDVWNAAAALAAHPSLRETRGEHP